MMMAKTKRPMKTMHCVTKPRRAPPGVSHSSVVASAPGTLLSK